MPAKTKYVSKLTQKDEQMLKAFSSVGYLTKDQIKTDLGQADKRIKNFERDKYIEKVSYIDKETKDANFAYRLTDKGKELCQNQLNQEYFYRSNSPQHDLALSKEYLNSTQEQRENWVTESEWRDRFEDRLEALKTSDYTTYVDVLEKWQSHEISPPDGGYVMQESVVAIEVITANYDASAIEAKTEFARVMELVYTQTRA